MRILAIVMCLLLPGISLATPEPPVLFGVTTNQPVTDAGFALPFDYVVQENKMKYISLGAWNKAITYNRLLASELNWPRRYKAWRLGAGVETTVGTVEFDGWFVESLPRNGQLFDNGIQIQAPGQISGPDSLVYVPDSGFVGDDEFTYTAHSATTQSKTTVAPVRLRIASPAAYPYPTAFPKIWGMDLEPPADPSGWPNDEVEGFYYIDSDSPNCSSDVQFGSPATPRCTFVNNNTKVPAGGKVVLAPSSEPYRMNNSGSHRITLDGNQSNPTWLVGLDDAPIKPILTTAQGRDSFTEFQLNGSHLIVSGIVFENSKVVHRHNKDDGEVDSHILFRHSEVKNYSGTNGSGISLATQSTMATNATDVAIFNVSVHDNGYRDLGLQERDVHGMGFSACSECTILDVVSYGNGGDSYQNLQHNNNGQIYIGRLVGHSEGENCVDIKAQNGLWVVDSSCWDLRRVIWANGSSGNGQGFFQNDDDCSNSETCEQLGDVVFLNNRVWDTNGPGIESSISNGAHYIVGNRVFASPEGSCINVENSNGHSTQDSETHIYFNTLSNCGNGISVRANADQTRVAGNIINDSENAVWMLNRNNYDLFDYNFYSSPSSQVNFQCCSNGSPIFHEGLVAWQVVSRHDANSIVEPGLSFESQTLDDFRLVGSESGAIDKFSPSDVSQLMPGISSMLSVLGVSSVTDWNGTQRFDGDREDAGADER